MTVANAELPEKAIPYELYYRLPEDVREYVSQFAISEQHIPLIRKGMHNSRMVQTELALKGETVIVAKPVYIKVSNEGITVKTPTVKFLIPFTAINLDTNKNLEQELIEAEYEPERLFGDFCIYQLYNYTVNTRFGEKTEVRCNSYKIIAKKTDIQSAQKLIEKCGGVLQAFNRIMGWKDNWALCRLNFVRLFSVITGEHSFQLTGVNTGKTYFSIRFMLGENYGYFTTAITPARLIYNASSRTEGEVFLRNGIIIDELSVISNLNEMEENLYSGLENGVWSRGVSGAEALSERKRRIPFLFFGNLPAKPFSLNNSREYIGKILEQLRFHNVQAFLDRIAICDVFPESINASELVNDYFYPNSILRGFVDVLKKKYREIRHQYNDEYFTGELQVGEYKLSSGRMNRYANDLKCFAEICGIELTDTQLKNIILGNIQQLDAVFKQMFGVNEDKPEEQPKQSYTSEINQQELAEDIIEVINRWEGSASLSIITDELHKVKYSNYPEDKLRNEIQKVLNQLIEQGILTTQCLTDGIITYCFR